MVAGEVHIPLPRFQMMEKFGLVVILITRIKKQFALYGFVTFL